MKLAQVLNLPGGTIGQTGTTKITGIENFRYSSLGSLVSELIPYFVLFAGVGMLLMIIMAGFQILTGANNPKQLEGGQKRLTYAIVGFFIVFFAFWIVQGVAIMFNIREWRIIFGGGG
jgi:hypothetical protein